MIATDARTASTAFRETPRPTRQTCHSGSARRTPAPLVSSRPEEFGNSLATPLPMQPQGESNVNRRGVSISSLESTVFQRQPNATRLPC
jgi:hypothetical protein